MIKGTTYELDISHIVSEFEIGNQLAINLRQSATAASNFPGFITIKNHPSSTKVLIDASSSASQLGTYTLVLESFDENSSVQASLKTDRIEVSIVKCPAFSVASLDTVVVPQAYSLSEDSFTWTLPSEAEQSCDFDPIVAFNVLPEFGLRSYITFENSTRTVTFNSHNKAAQDSSKGGRRRLAAAEESGAADAQPSAAKIGRIRVEVVRKSDFRDSYLQLVVYDDPAILQAQQK